MTWEDNGDVPQTLKELVGLRSELRHAREDLQRLPIMKIVGDLQARCRALEDDTGLKTWIGRRLVAALSRVARVELFELTGRVHARIGLTGEHEDGDVVVGEDPVRQVVTLVESSLPAALLELLVLEIRSKRSWGPFASFDYYAGRSVEQVGQGVCV